MTALAHLTLLHADDKACAALRFGFEREGTQVTRVESAEGLESSIDKGCQLIITGGESKSDARQKLALVEGVLLSAASRVRVLYFGNSISRTEALACGAHEFLSQPAFIRDVLTLSKLMATPMERRTQSISGELAEHFGLFYLVRALGVARYSGVLTLLRGLRRGELRLQQGDVTSATLGTRQGLAALHHSLLWTNARFDLREEKTSQHRKISLGRAELIRDCEQFLRETRNAGGGLPASIVLERDEEKDTSGLPSQALEVLDVFDGTNSLADVIEDSPQRTLETLRITRRLIDQGFLKSTSRQGSDHMTQSLLAIDEWLVGGPLIDNRNHIAGGISSALETGAALVSGPARGTPASPPKQGVMKPSSPDSRSVDRSDGKAVASGYEQSRSDEFPHAAASQSLSGPAPKRIVSGEVSQDKDASTSGDSLGNGVGNGADRPSARASRGTRVSRRAGTEPPPIPVRERLEETSSAGSLSNIFVDASLGAVHIEASKALPDSEGSLEDLHCDAWVGDEGSDYKGSSTDVVPSADPLAVALSGLKVERPSRESIVCATDIATSVLPKAQGPASSESTSSAHSEAYFSPEEEAFFDEGAKRAKAPPAPIESFEDLDDDYDLPKSFLKRLMANPDLRQRKKKR